MEFYERLEVQNMDIYTRSAVASLKVVEAISVRVGLPWLYHQNLRYPKPHTFPE